MLVLALYLFLHLVFFFLALGYFFLHTGFGFLHVYSSLFLFSDSLIFFFLTLPFLSPSYCPTFYPSVLLFFSLSVFILNFWLSYPLSFLLFLSYLSLLLSNLLTFWLFYPLSLLPVLTVFLTSSPLLPYLPFFSFGHSKIPIGIFLLDAVVTTKDKHCQSGRRFFIKHFFWAV